MTIGTHPWSDADTHFLQNVMVHSGFGIIFPTWQGVVAFCSAAIATCACAAYECKRKMICDMIDYKTLVSTLSVNGNHAQILFVRAIRVEVKLISNTEHGKVLLYKYCDQRCNGDVTVKDVICNGVLHEDQQTRVREVYHEDLSGNSQLWDEDKPLKQVPLYEGMVKLQVILAAAGGAAAGGAAAQP